MSRVTPLVSEPGAPGSPVDASVPRDLEGGFEGAEGAEARGDAPEGGLAGAGGTAVDGVAEADLPGRQSGRLPPLRVPGKGGGSFVASQPGGSEISSQSFFNSGAAPAQPLQPIKRTDSSGKRIVGETMRASTLDGSGVGIPRVLAVGSKAGRKRPSQAQMGAQTFSKFKALQMLGMGNDSGRRTVGARKELKLHDKANMLTLVFRDADLEERYATYRTLGCRSAKDKYALIVTLLAPVLFDLVQNGHSVTWISAGVVALFVALWWLVLRSSRSPEAGLVRDLAIGAVLVWHVVLLTVGGCKGSGSSSYYCGHGSDGVEHGGYDDGAQSRLVVLLIDGMAVPTFAWLSWPVFLLCFASSFVVQVVVHKVSAAMAVKLGSLVLVCLYQRYTQNAAHRLNFLYHESLEDHSDDATRTLAFICHEIRNPLSAIIGNAEMMGDTDMDVEQAELVSDLYASCQQLRAVVNDILDLTKIGYNKMELEDVVLSPYKLAKNAVSQIRASAAQKGVNLSFTVDAGRVPELVVGDPARLGQCCANYLSNAVKFTPSGGAVRLHVEVESTSGKFITLRFACADTGPGVSPAEQARLFQSFSQASTSIARRHGGTGLGLTIVKELADLMGGHTGVESKVGEGSTFWFTAVVSSATSEQVDEATVHGTFTSSGNQIAHGTTEDVGSPVDVFENARAFGSVKLSGESGAATEVRLPPKGLGQAPMNLVVMPRSNSSCSGASGDSVDRSVGTPAAALNASSGRSLGVSAIHALVVDDDPMIRKFVSRILSKWGMQVDEAKEGGEALEKIKRAHALKKEAESTASLDAVNASAAYAPFEVVTMDIQMSPGLCGEDCTKAIRAWESENSLKRALIVALTSNVDAPDVEAYMACGMDAVQSKPVVKKQLFRTITGLLARSTILILDDQAPIRKAQMKMLTRAGHSVQACATSFEAQEAFAAARASGNPFQLLMFDNNLAAGDLSGAETLKAIRDSVDDDEMPPAVLVSGNSYSSTELKAQGFDHHLEKPVSRQALIDLANMLLGTAEDVARRLQRRESASSVSSRAGADGGSKGR